MKNKDSNFKDSSHGIENALFAAQEGFGLKVKRSLLGALSRAYQLIHIIEGKETAIKLIWQYLRPGEEFPPKKITDKQKEKVLEKMKELIEFNNAAIEVYKESMPKELAEQDIALGQTAYNSLIGAPHNEPDEVKQFLKEHGAYGIFFINDWEGIGYAFVDNYRDRFLHDYLTGIEDFSEILFDKKALMCTADIHSQLPISIRRGPLSDRIKEFCYLLCYAYLGILPTGNREFDDRYVNEFFSLEGIDIKKTSPDSFIEYIFTQTSISMQIIFGKSIPKFLEAGMQAAECRLKLDRGLPVSASTLSKLAGVDRKSIVNAKLSEDTNSISTEEALAFLSQKARNRWTEKDEDGDPIGLKFLHVQAQLGLDKNFYPSAQKLKTKTITSKEK